MHDSVKAWIPGMSLVCEKEDPALTVELASFSPFPLSPPLCLRGNQLELKHRLERYEAPTVCHEKTRVKKLR